MTYRNFTMDELGDRLQSEPNHVVFIEMAKEFIQKFYDGSFIGPDELEGKLDDARSKGYDEGALAGAEESMVELDQLRQEMERLTMLF